MNQPVETEQIVLVDDTGKPIGSAPKLASHHNKTPLHLAFSVYIFNDAGEVLVTKRASSKKVWPNVWTNSCCGHPMPNESTEAAITRRLRDELDVKVTDLACVLPDYRYKTPPFNGIIENEICPVYTAKINSSLKPNPSEVATYKWLAPDALIQETGADTTNKWSWWCKDQLKQLLQQGIISA